jgi:hypothetical protein
MVTTLAGGASSGFADGIGSQAAFSYPFGITLDVSGNLFVADSGNHRLRMVTAAGVVSTIAGGVSGTNGAFADGTGSQVGFSSPWGVSLDNSGNVIVTDSGNQLVRKVTTLGTIFVAGVTTTVAGQVGTASSVDNTGTLATFNVPSGVTVDVSANTYVSEAIGQRLRKITTGGVVSTVAGPGDGSQAYVDGTGTQASFYRPFAIAAIVDGRVFVADTSNELLRQVNSTHVVTTIAGSGAKVSLSKSGFAPGGGPSPTPYFLQDSDWGFAGSYANGIGTQAAFSNPRGLAVDVSGNFYVGDTYNLVIRKISSSGMISLFVGDPLQDGLSDGEGTQVRFSSPTGMAVDVMGNIYTADSKNHCIRKVTAPTSGIV